MMKRKPNRFFFYVLIWSESLVYTRLLGEQSCGERENNGFSLTFDGVIIILAIVRE